jgi:hypothetical protein
MSNFIQLLSIQAKNYNNYKVLAQIKPWTINKNKNHRFLTTSPPTTTNTNPTNTEQQQQYRRSQRRTPHPQTKAFFLVMGFGCAMGTIITVVNFEVAKRMPLPTRQNMTTSTMPAIDAVPNNSNSNTTATTNIDKSDGKKVI